MNEKFYFYRSFYNVLKELPVNHRDELVMAIMDYAFTGEHKELSPFSSAHFVFFKQKIDANKSRGANGYKGGRGKKKIVEEQTI